MIKLILLLGVAIVLIIAAAAYGQTSQTSAQYVTESTLLKALLGLVLTNGVVMITAAIRIGRGILGRLDHHSEEIEAHTTELVRIGVSIDELSKGVSRIEGRLQEMVRK